MWLKNGRVIADHYKCAKWKNPKSSDCLFFNLLFRVLKDRNRTIKGGFSVIFVFYGRMRGARIRSAEGWKGGGVVMRMGT